MIENVIFGGSQAEDDLTLDSTANNSKGDVIIQPDGGNVGIGVTPAAENRLQVDTASILASSIAGYFRHDGTVTGTAYGIYNEAVGTTTLNIAGFFTATGAGSNQALVTGNGDVILCQISGNVGIGTTDFGSGAGVIGIANATTVPTANPTGGGVLYVQGGALKYRGSGGTITTIAPA